MEEMEQSKDSPLAPSDGPLQKTAPLAPSQETAYRKKCIQLKRRLQETEADNDAKRKRIEREKQHVQKMRLNRSILLEHLKTIMDTPGTKLTPDQLAQIGIVANGAGHAADFIGPDDSHKLQDGEGLLDDSSDESEEEAEPAERPERRRRTNPPLGEAIMTTSTSNNPAQPLPSSYPSVQPGLPNIAPASSFSPVAAGRNPSNYSFQIESVTPQPAIAVPAGRQYQIQHPSEYPQSSPHQSMAYSTPVPPPSAGLNEPPPRPDVPYKQFTDHMRPQLEADDYPGEQIESRIQQEWANLSPDNRQLWDTRYQEQMAEFTKQMDDYKRQQRQQGGSFSESRNRTVNPPPSSGS